MTQVLQQQMCVEGRGIAPEDSSAQLKGREFTKGGLVKGGLASRHVFMLHIKNGT